MLNLQSKFGQKLLVVGDWFAALVTINLVWFVINLPVLVMLILAVSLPLNGLYAAAIGLILIMFAAFTVPATTAVYQAVKTWQLTDSGSFIKETWRAYLKALMNWQPNVLIAFLMSGWLTVFRLSTANVASHVATLVIGFALLALWNGWNYSQVSATSVMAIMVAHPFKLLLSALVMIGLFLINFELRLLFCILLVSMSLSALATYRIFNPKEKIEELKKLAEENEL